MNIEGKHFVLWLSQKLKKLKPKKIYCVVGAYKEKIIPLLKEEKIKILINNDFEKGMMSSIKLGLNNIQEDKTFILPIDCPMTNKKVFKKLLSYELAYPVYNNRGGHPVLISKKYFSEISNNADRLDKWLKNQKNLIRIKVDTEDVLLNLNTDIKIENFIKRRRETGFTG